MFWIAVVFIAALAMTRANVLGDTELYAANIVANLGQSPVGHASALWEFGHLLWRPVGWVVLSLTAPVLSAITGWSPFEEACFVLIALGVASSVVTVMLWYRLALDVTGSPRLAFALGTAFAFSHGFLLYAHSGCAYATGLLCITASLYCLRRDRLVAGAILYGLAALFWLPYILVGGALVALAAFPGVRWNTSLQDSWRSIRIARAVRFVAISAACVVLALLLALAARRTSSIKEARDWYSESQHGWSQNIKAVRIATGLPRSFLYLGKDGVLYRRYLRHDRYAPVALGDLVKASLWKLALFDLFVVCLLWELFRRPRAGWPLILFLLAAGPVVFFAVVLFEPGSPERYLPALPFLLIAIAWVLRDFPENHRATQIVIAVFLVCMVLNNGFLFFRPRVSAEDAASWQRVAALRPQLNAASLLALVTNQDPIEEVVSRSPFDLINSPQQLPIYDIVEPATFRVLEWREEFAARSLGAWKRGGEVWVSRRVWATQPQPEWDWVEGDDPRISWAQIPQFFEGLATDADSGGADGFLRLKHSDANTARLTPLADAVALTKQ